MNEWEKNILSFPFSIDVVLIALYFLKHTFVPLLFSIGGTASPFDHLI